MRPPLGYNSPTPFFCSHKKYKNNIKRTRKSKKKDLEISVTCISENVTLNPILYYSRRQWEDFTVGQNHDYPINSNRKSDVNERFNWKTKN